jgi:hypothetical protein
MKLGIVVNKDIGPNLQDREVQCNRVIDLGHGLGETRDGGVMDAGASAGLYLGTLAPEDFQDELELELWGMRFGLLLALRSPLRLEEKITPPGGADTVALGVVRIYGRITLTVREWWHDPTVTFDAPKQKI